MLDMTGKSLFPTGNKKIFENFCCKISKNPKGGLFSKIKNFRKKIRTEPKKIERGDPLESSGFVGYVKKVKNERGDPLQ